MPYSGDDGLRDFNSAKTKTMAEDPALTEDTSRSFLDLKIKYDKAPPSQYVNQLLVQCDEQCMYLHFYQTRPPVFLPGDTAPEPTTVDSQAVSSIAISVEQAPKFLAAIQAQLDQIERIRAHVHSNP